ncbi:MAG: dihydroorotase [Candidatus Peregrinibacteria bacterium Greene0416_62]|nr:MAG: dihydroorotase [Candidatus Peregrinibacteria bacterium Greene0416_62]TSC99817.1 MAG: dihydroorotase [Candidatus Peregrinibacteria bacterium Greene1014_49]
MSNIITLPGLIDCHVHFREPGLIHKGDMASESAAAVAGGVTTVCEMPNTIPATVSVEALADKVRRAAKIQRCDIRFFMGATEKQHLLALRDIWRGSSPVFQQLKKRCCGLKVYFDHSTGNQGADQETTIEAFRMCGELGVPLVAHCEDAALNMEAQSAVLRSGEPQLSAADVSLHSQMRPPESEIAAVKHAIALAKEYSTQFHVAHLSTAGGLQLVREAKKEGLPVTCEVAPHHLFLTIEDYATLGTLGKMNPPLRSKEDQAALWAGIADGTVDCIATDHAPHTLEEKQSGDPLKAPSGVPGVETMLPLLLTVAAGGWPHPTGKKVAGCKLQIADIVRLCFENPNRIFGLGKKKDEYQIEIDLEKEWIIEGKNLHSKCGWTPYEGWRVTGSIQEVNNP